MKSIIDFIAEETHGKAYKSHRFCYDKEVPLPSLAYDDNLTFTIRNDRYGETAPKKETSSLEKLAKALQKEEQPIFSFFLDGSRRIYKVDDIEYQKRIFPIIGGQIGVACCERKSPDVFRTAILEKHLVLSVPSAADLGQHHDLALGKLVKDINDSERLQRLGVSLSSILKYEAKKADKDKEEYMNLGTATIQDKMIECEKKVVYELVRKNLLHEDCYLIKDGSLQYPIAPKSDFKELARYKSNYRRVVGVSKSFNPELIHDNRNKSNAATIANLPLYCRTPVARFESSSRVGKVDFGVWYVRIRSKETTDSPFAGILKIEKVLVSPDEIEYGLDSGEVDRITANIINERNPVCYGRDQRWANHLYPIYLTEGYLKSQYLSDLHFINLF